MHILSYTLMIHYAVRLTKMDIITRDGIVWPHTILSVAFYPGTQTAISEKNISYI